MALPYPTKVVLPFDIATAQDMNERHANDVALAGGTGINDGAITASKLDFTTLAFGNYSTTEKDTGFKWTNGTTIYKKTINFGSLPNNTGKDVAHNITNLSQLIELTGMVTFSTGTRFPLPFVSIGSAGTQIQIAVSNTVISITTGSDRSSGTAYVTLLYTKS